MLFSSLEFLYLFLPCALIAYFLAPRQAKNAVLLTVSLIFYALGEPKYLPVLLLCTLTGFIGARLMGSPDAHRGAARKAVFVVAVLLNVATLVFFKYLDTVLKWLSVSPIGIFLPLGISFYVFQILSYLADVYLGRVEPQRDAVKLFTYVTLFPQLVAGPIVKYSEVSDALDLRSHSVSGAASGVRLFCIGLAKKVLLANPAGEVWDRIVSSPELYSSTLSAWLGVIFFALQIYFDFSGYSDMARGLGRIFGFSFPKNFNYPYASQSITEFWRRWHITLSSWFREYIYIPLGGNRRGRARTYLNLLAVWSLTGLWHGAGANFIAWGLYFFVLIALEKLFFGKVIDRIPRIFRHAYALFFILCGWPIFAFDSSLPSLSASAGADYFLRLFGVGAESVRGEEIYLATRQAPFLLISALAATPFGAYSFERISESRESAHAVANILAISALLICTAYLVDSGYNPFLYFRF
ncbi:MAG: MBOAT family protein [Clostridia bacterium]|nr:MBOAT family protein [Clostridia bacterium]